jgi:hypothetical protein
MRKPSGYFYAALVCGLVAVSMLLSCYFPWLFGALALLSLLTVGGLWVWCYDLPETDPEALAKDNDRLREHGAVLLGQRDAIQAACYAVEAKVSAQGAALEKCGRERTLLEAELRQALARLDGARAAADLHRERYQKLLARVADLANAAEED